MIQPDAQIIGKRYALLESLGAGNMGTVNRAIDRLTGHMVAVKQIKAPGEQVGFDSQESEDAAQLTLAQEFKMMASLRHPHIISVLDYGFHLPPGGQSRLPYITMELLENADSFLETAERVPFVQQIDLLLQMLQALVYLHRRAVLHRDLKPKNVLVVNGQVKVLDFGLSVATDKAREGEVAGTPSYMAPELWTGRPASRQSDLYAVGMMAFRLFAGQHPFDTSNMQKLFRQTQTLTPDVSLMHTTDAVRLVVARLLAKDPADRYDDAADVIAALRTATGRPLPVETAATRESFLQAATFVGREQEEALLAQVLGEAINGMGSAWLLAGESGVGKSRLMDETRTRALVQGALVLRGQAIGEASPPYFLWHSAIRWLTLLADVDDRQASILKSLVPDIDKLLGVNVPDAPEVAPQAAQTRLLRVIEALFVKALTGTSTRQPIVLMLEDLHWADGESLTLLARIVQIARDLPLLIVGTFRDDESPDLPLLLPGMKSIKLERLNAEQTSRLAEAMLGAAGRSAELLKLLQRETEGNTFFLVEAVRALAEESGQLDRVGAAPLPVSVLTGGMEGILQRRLNRVPVEARNFLRIAAVSGRYPDLGVVSEVLKADGQAALMENWMTDCADAAVLEVHEGDWRFTHNKMRDGVLKDIPPAESAHLHQRAAESMESVYQYSAKPTAETLAYLWRMAGDATKEEHYAALAGEQSVRDGAYRVAQTFLERALELQQRTEAKPHRQATIRQQLGDAYLETRQIDQARTMFTQSLKLFREVDYRWGESSSTIRLGMVAMEQQEYEAAAAFLIEGLKIAQQSRAKTMTLAALTSMGDLLSRTEQRSTAVEYLTLVINHLSTDAQTAYTAERLRNGLKMDMPHSEYTAAEARGGQMQLNDVIRRILEG